MCPVYSVNDVTGLYLTAALSQRERENKHLLSGTRADRADESAL